MDVLLIDTNVFIWLAFDNPMLGNKSRITLKKTSKILLSSLSILEMKIKMANNKLHFDNEIIDIVNSMNIEVLNYDANQSTNFKYNGFNKDPFDNALCSIAQILKIPLITSDNQILNSKIKGIEVIDAKK